MYIYRCGKGQLSEFLSYCVDLLNPGILIADNVYKGMIANDKSLKEEKDYRKTDE